MTEPVVRCTVWRGESDAGRRRVSPPSSGRPREHVCSASPERLTLRSNDDRASVRAYRYRRTEVGALAPEVGAGARGPGRGLNAASCTDIFPLRTWRQRVDVCPIAARRGCSNRASIRTHRHRVPSTPATPAGIRQLDPRRSRFPPAGRSREHIGSVTERISCGGSNCDSASVRVRRYRPAELIARAPSGRSQPSIRGRRRPSAGRQGEHIRGARRFRRPSYYRAPVSAYRYGFSKLRPCVQLGRPGQLDSRRRRYPSSGRHREHVHRAGRVAARSDRDGASVLARRYRRPKLVIGLAVRRSQLDCPRCRDPPAGRPGEHVCRACVFFVSVVAVRPDDDSASVSTQ